MSKYLLKYNFINISNTINIKRLRYLIQLNFEVDIVIVIKKLI